MSSPAPTQQINVGAPAPYVPPVIGAKVLVIGGTGQGKTHSLRTFAKRKIRTIVLFTENGMSSLSDTSPEDVDWVYIPPAPVNLPGMIQMSKNINTMDRKQLANVQDAYRHLHNQFVKVLEALSNLKGDRTGKTYGKVDALGPDVCLALDSLSGTSIMSMELVGGEKPIFDQGEWGMAMQRIEKMVQFLCFSVPCHLVVNAHEERETDEISGATKIMVSVPGRKLAPKIPRFFDDVFYAYRKDRTWNWSTNYPQVADLKSRHLGIFESNPQDYSLVIDSWQARQQGSKPNP